MIEIEIKAIERYVYPIQFGKYQKRMIHSKIGLSLELLFDIILIGYSLGDEIKDSFGLSPCYVDIQGNDQPDEFGNIFWYFCYVGSEF